MIDIVIATILVLLGMALIICLLFINLLCSLVDTTKTLKPEKPKQKSVSDNSYDRLSI